MLTLTVALGIAIALTLTLPVYLTLNPSPYPYVVIRKTLPNPALLQPVTPCYSLEGTSKVLRLAGRNCRLLHRGQGRVRVGFGLG